MPTAPRVTARADGIMPRSTETAAQITAPPLSGRPPFFDPNVPGIFELVYTSAPHGLRLGSSGFCTVAMTRGMPPELIERLESLSSYASISATTTDGKSRDPVTFAHWRLPMAGKTRSVLTRIAFGQLDYSRRPGKIAYHVVLDSSQQPIGGPAWTMLQPTVMEHSWVGEPALLAPTKSAPVGDGAPSPCVAWENAGGDAGWAGVLAESFLLDPSKAAYLIYQPSLDIFPLVAEAAALLPPRLRWQLTFMTCFTSLPAGLECAWRGVLAGTPAAEKACRLSNGSLVLDLTQKLGAAPRCPAVEKARAGEILTMPAPAGASETRI